MTDIGPGYIIGRYEIQQRIGQGGFAMVYLAIDAELGRSVAIKINRHERFDYDGSSPLKNEARILAALQHPSILNVFDVGEQSGRIHLVLEYVEGGTLREVIRDGASPLPHTRLADIAANIADALDYVHRRGYIHRNIKPQVILLDSNGRPRLSGFEVAVQTEGLDPRSIAGTPAYMAPEQFSGDADPLGPHTDVWGLGVTIYECLTGQRPFQGTSIHELRERIANTDPEPPSNFDSTIPDELQRICLKCLSRTPTDRYVTAELLAGDLRAWQRGTQPQEQRGFS
ncbi:MAG: serine/threonine protein kinase [Planctomycetaceae bacterium]